MLASMFSGRFCMDTDADGSYFIDRDGEMFAHILNFLRNGCVAPPLIPESDITTRNALMLEASFFGLAPLVDFLKNGELVDLSVSPTAGKIGSVAATFAQVRYLRGYELSANRNTRISAIYVKVYLPPEGRGVVQIFDGEKILRGSVFRRPKEEGKVKKEERGKEKEERGKEKKELGTPEWYVSRLDYGLKQDRPYWLGVFLGPELTDEEDDDNEDEKAEPHFHYVEIDTVMQVRHVDIFSLQARDCHPRSMDNPKGWNVNAFHIDLRIQRL